VGENQGLLLLRQQENGKPKAKGYSLVFTKQQQQENKSQPFGWLRYQRQQPLGMALLVFPCSSSRANPLGMALLVFLLLCSSPWFSPAPQQGKLKPKAAAKAAVAEPTLWVWLC
jgi:hypothetical protein